MRRFPARIVNGFYGGAIQYFPTDRVFLGGGVGLGLFGPNPLYGDPSGDMEAGVALNARVGFYFWLLGEHALGFIVEAFPSFMEDAAVFGLAVNFQWQYY
jgi:hypothetical protein